MTFPEIELSKQELLLLESLKASPNPQLGSSSYDRLSKLGLVQYFCHGGERDPLHVRITDKGVDYLAFRKARTNDKRVEWIRYSITTAIAVIALLKAFDRELSELLAWLSSL